MDISLLLLVGVIERDHCSHEFPMFEIPNTLLEGAKE